MTASRPPIPRYMTDWRPGFRSLSDSHVGFFDPSSFLRPGIRKSGIWTVRSVVTPRASPAAGRVRPRCLHWRPLCRRCLSMKGRGCGAPKRHVTFHGHAHTPRRIWADEVVMLRDIEKNGQRSPHINCRCSQREIHRAITDIQHKAIQPEPRTHFVKEFDKSGALLRSIFFVIFD